MILKEDSHTSIRAVAIETGLSKSSVHKMVKQNRYHPYKMTKIQHLRITDSQRHLNLIAWLVVTYESNPEILQNIRTDKYSQIMV